MKTNQKKLKETYNIEDLINLTTNQVIDNIKLFLQEHLNIQEYSQGQIVAWEKSIELLKIIFTKNNPHWKIIFEFPIPMSSGKRPDILLLNGENIFLIEVKNKSNYTVADIDQVKGYQLDLTFYHSSAKYFEIQPILILLEAQNVEKVENDILIISPERLKNTLVKKNKDFLVLDPKSLFDGYFKPVPSITEYAKSVYNNTEIKNVEIPEIKASEELHKEIKNIYLNLKENKEKGIVFIRGEAGTGKSAIGLNAAYNLNGLYVTKNRQFYEHLSTEIGSYSNLTTSHSFVKEYANSNKSPNWNVVVFDEAQRFLPYSKMKKYFSIDADEQEVILDFFKNKDWCLLIVLIGFGQEIGYGEYDDLNNWKYALKHSESEWKIFGSKYTSKLLERPSKFTKHNNFDLFNSFRNLRSSIYPQFINNILDYEGKFNHNDFFKLQKQYKEIDSRGFKIIITRNFDRAIKYCENRFKDSPNSYCSLASSECYLDEDELNNFYSNQIKTGYENSNNLDINQYLKNNSVKNNHFYSLTEYSSIGFEVEMPIITWGYDFLWYKEQWNYEFNRKMRGGVQYRKNTYRIFLTRGRNGTILFFPPTWEFDDTYKLFRKLGATTI